MVQLRDDPVACGALKLHGNDPAEIKRMWVAPPARGLGLGRRLLRELEEQAGKRGATRARLETNRALTEAIDLYLIDRIHGGRSVQRRAVCRSLVRETSRQLAVPPTEVVERLEVHPGPRSRLWVCQDSLSKEGRMLVHRNAKLGPAGR